MPAAGAFLPVSRKTLHNRALCSACAKASELTACLLIINTICSFQLTIRRFDYIILQSKGGGKSVFGQKRADTQIYKELRTSLPQGAYRAVPGRLRHDLKTRYGVSGGKGSDNQDAGRRGGGFAGRGEFRGPVFQARRSPHKGKAGDRLKGSAACPALLCHVPGFRLHNAAVYQGASGR